MSNLECPHCHKPAIPAWRKAMLGPARSVTCSECGGKFSVSWSSMWVTIPFVAAIAVAPLFKSGALTVLLWVAGAVVALKVTK